MRHSVPFSLHSFDGSTLATLLIFFQLLSNCWDCISFASLSIGASMCVTAHTTSELFLFYFLCPKWESYVPPEFPLRTFPSKYATMHWQFSGTQLVCAPSQTFTPTDGSATSRGVLLSFSNPVFISALDDRSVFWNVVHLALALTWELTKRWPSIPCVIYHIVAQHGIKSVNNDRLASIHHRLALLRESIQRERQRRHFRFCLVHFHSTVQWLGDWQGHPSIPFQLCVFERPWQSVTFYLCWTYFSREQ